MLNYSVAELRVLISLNRKCRFTGELTGKAEPRAASSLLPSALADE